MALIINPHSNFTVPSIFSTGLFPAFTFTNASAIGPVGPTVEQCQTAYSGRSDIVSSLSVNFGYQSFVIPFTGTYTFTVNGASGGVWTVSPMSGSSAALAPTIEGYKRVPGATVTGSHALTQGQIITIVVGQGGGDDNNVAANCPGGGGGTFVTLGTFAQIQAGTDTLLFVAGGGGGAGYQAADVPVDSYVSAVGQTTTSGGNSTETGAINGNGGPNVFTPTNSCGGAGYLTGLGLSTIPDFSYTIPSSAGPFGFRQGAKGGSATGLTRGWGGFGGGGCGASTTTSDDDKGGGGGYSGGGYAFDANAFGGGGGSYSIGSATGVTITAGGNTTQRHGSVTLSLVG